MKLDIASLAIGAALGFAIVAATAEFVMLPATTGPAHQTAVSTVASGNDNSAHFFMSGLITEISDDTMVIDQTFGNPEYHDNPAVAVKLSRGAAFVSCVGTGILGESCKDSVVSRIGKEQVYVCVHTRVHNWEFYSGKIWADSSCGPFSAPGGQRERSVIEIR